MELGCESSTKSLPHIGILLLYGKHQINLYGFEFELNFEKYHGDQQGH